MPKASTRPYHLFYRRHYLVLARHLARAIRTTPYVSRAPIIDAIGAMLAEDAPTFDRVRWRQLVSGFLVDTDDDRDDMDPAETTWIRPIGTAMGDAHDDKS